MELEGQIALVTGANRGFGRALAAELLKRGVRVYGGARNPETVTLEGVTPVAIDITAPDSVAKAAAKASDVTILINNAGVLTGADALTGAESDVRLEMETHYFGTLNVAREFAPILKANGGGTMLNILSVLSWYTFPGVGAYSAAKAAEWALTNALRNELAKQGTTVIGLHVGYMDTDLVRERDGHKSAPEEIATLAVDGIASGQLEIVADDLSRQVQQGLAGGVSALYPPA